MDRHIAGGAAAHLKANKETDMASSRQIERTAAAWIARRDAGRWSDFDQAELDAWLAASTAHRVAFVRLEDAWRQSDRLKALGAGLPRKVVPQRGQWMGYQLDPRARDIEAAAARSHPAVPPPIPRQAFTPIDAASLVFGPRKRPAKPRRIRFAVAAVTLLLTGSLVLGWRYDPTVQAVSYSTAVGDMESMSLADGSQAQLSSDSRILVALSRRERRVDLQQGEAYFHAAKDPDRPFVVSAGGRRVVAVGTRFSVRRDDQGVRVVVTEGLVRLESDAGPDGRRRPSTLLPAGSVAIADNAGILVRSGTLQEAEQHLSWREGFLAFHDTPLTEAAAEFNRYNARKIVIADPEVGAMRIGGNFRWSNTEVFVRLLEQGFPVRAERDGDAIVLHGE
jgi:transmembrane sensor